jgi:hypothetical protein
MPSKSQAQHNLMAAVANNPKFAKKAGIPQTVGADYMKADKKVKKYKKGGMPMVEKGGEKVPFYAPSAPSLPLLKKKRTSAEALADLKKRQEELAMRNMVRDAMGSKLDDPNTRIEIGGKEAKGLKKGGKIRGYGMARGGKVCKMR